MPDDDDENTPDATVEVHVEQPEPDPDPEPAAPVQIVEIATPEAPADGVPEWGVELIRRLDAFEAQRDREQLVDALTPAVEEAAVEEAAAEAEEAAEEAQEAAAEAEEAAEEIEPEPHRTHPFFRSWSEWRGH